MNSTTKPPRTGRISLGQRFRSSRWSPLGVVALPALLLVALDPRAASAGPPQAGKSSPSKSSKASKADPKLEVRKSINQIDGLTVEEFADGTTILRVLGHVEPTFNVYRLSDPDRLVVDIAKSERGKAVPHVPVDSWAVGRVSITSVDEHDSKLARVVVNLKRESSYIVVPKGRDLAITITPKEVAPEAYFARKSAGERQAEIETMKTEARKHAEQLEAAAEAKASSAEAKASSAEAKASTAEQRAREAEKRAAEAASRAREAEREAAEIRSEAESIRARAERAASEREAIAAANAEQVEGAAEAKAKQVESAAAEKAKQVESAAAEKARQLAVEAEEKAKQAEEKARQAEAKTKRLEGEAAEKARKLAVEAEEKAKQAEAKAKQAEAKAKRLEAEAEERARQLAVEAEEKAKEKARQLAVEAEEKAKEKARQLEVEAAEKARQLAVEAEAKAKQAEAKAKQAEANARQAEAKAKQLEGAAADKAKLLAVEAEDKAKQAEAKAKQAEAKAKQAEARAKQLEGAALAKAKQVEGEAVAKAKQVEGAAVEKAKQVEGEAVAKAKQLEAETVRTLDEARRLAEARGAVLGDAEQAAEEAERKAAHAEQRAAEAKAEAEAAEAYAKRVRKSAEAKAKQAEQLLATAEAAMQQATQEGEQAKHAYDEAKQMLADARKAARKLGKRDASERAELERAVEQAESATAAAKQRAQEAEDRLTKIERDREALASALAAKQAEAEQRNGEQAKAIAEAEAEARAARSRYEALGREEQKEKDKESKRELREAKSALAKAEAELAKARKEAAANQAKLEALQTQVASAGEQLGETLAADEDRRSLRQQWEDERKAAGHAVIRDVRFEDGPDSARVVVELDGPVVYDASSLTPNMTMLELRDVSIPAGLERSLDTTGFHGPIDRITSFREGDDVKIVVASTMGEPAGIELDRKANRLIWKFPKHAGADMHAAPPSAAPPSEHFAAPPQVASDTTPERTEVVSLGGNKVSGFSTPAVLAARPGTKVGNRTRWRGERIDIELQDAPIKDVLLLFSDIGRVNIIAGPEVTGSVTMKLSAVPWDQALDIILRSLTLGMVQEGNVVRVSTQAALEEERRKAIEEANAAVQLKPLETRLIPLSYATVQDMLPKVQSVLSSRGSVTPDTRTNTLIVMDVAENIALAESLVGQLDSQTPQVLIEARIVEARTNWLRQLGIQWGFDFIASPGTGNPTGLLFPNSIGVGGGSGGNQSPKRGLILPGAFANPNYAVDLPAPVSTGSGGAIGFSFGSLSGNLNTNLRLSAAEEEGEVRIISAPKIVTLDNTEAQIEQGVQIPISQVSAQGVNTRYVNATLGLRVTPHVTNEGSVLLEVQVQKNEADFVNTGARGDPTILTKSAQSQLLIIDGDTAVIGGIYTRNQAVNYSQVPWFADIPIIGWFFKNKVERDDRSEMLIFLTPRIVNRSTSIGG